MGPQAEVSFRGVFFTYFGNWPMVDCGTGRTAGNAVAHRVEGSLQRSPLRFIVGLLSFRFDSNVGTMASLPPLGRDHPADPLVQSFASQRIKALGGRMTRTRQSPSAWRNGASPEFGREKIGPRTVIRAPMALLGKVLSEKDFRRAGERFPLTSHRRKRADPSPLESASSFPSFDPAFASPRPVEETKVKDSGDSELVEFAAKMKGIQLTVQLFAVKTLGEGHRPEAREGGTMITINRKMYVFGGRCRMMFNDIKVLDPETMKWEAHHSAPTLEGPPEPRMNHTAVPFKNQMVVYGGCDRFNDTLQFRNCFSLLHFYDTSEG